MHKQQLLTDTHHLTIQINCSGTWQPGEDGMYFIDRNPQYFQLILDYLRTGIRVLDDDHDGREN